MATQLIATGSTAATSADIIVAAGATATVFLKDADGGNITSYASIAVEIKDSAGFYTTIGQLTSRDPALVIAGAGTYRLRRDGGASCGAEQG